MKRLCSIVFLVLLGHMVLAAPKQKHLNSKLNSLLPVENHLKVLPYSGAKVVDTGFGPSDPVVHGMFTLNPWLSLTLPKGNNSKQPRLGNPLPQQTLLKQMKTQQKLNILNSAPLKNIKDQVNIGGDMILGNLRQSSNCSGLESSRGTLSFPLNGGNYGNNEDLCWIIRATNTLLITFISFNLENQYDYLTVRDGENQRSPIIGDYTGSSIPGPIETRTNAAFLRFTSDYSVTSTGFVLTWEPLGCGVEYTSSSGMITHPLNGGNYQNNENCIFIIRTDTPITITFDSFDTEQGYDYLYVRDGESSGSVLLGSFSGVSVPGPVQTTANGAYLLFTSDYSVTSTGFKILWEPSGTSTTEDFTEDFTTGTSSESSGGSDCACGQANRASRIVNGTETEENEYPWQAALVYAGSSSVFCGASVIGSKHILTAAHCTQAVTDYSLSYQVLVGAHGLSTAASSQLRLEPNRIIQHTDYDTSTLDNDISIIELNDHIDFTSSEVRPVCLPNSDANSYDSVTATVSGWGTTESGGSGPDVLLEVDLPTMSNTQCLESYGGGITDNMMCAGYEEGGKDSCQGDSGGPLFYNSGSGYTQIGVVSWGYGCASADYPGVYARVTKYLSWISDNSASSNTCPAA